MSKIIGVNFHKQENEYKWHLRFLDLAKLISTWGKDPSTKCGSVIVDKQKKIISTGYNGLPEKIKDTKKRLNDRSLKYQLTVHSEMNCLLQAKQSVEECIIYCYPMVACDRCTVILIQAGITKIVAPELPSDLVERWGKQAELTKEILDEAGVELIEI